MIRDLETADLIKMIRIVKKMNIKDDIKKISRDVTGLSDAEKKKAIQDYQIDLSYTLIENLPNAEKEIYKFLAELSGKTPAEIEHESPKETLEIINELFSQENFGDFLSQAIKS